MAFVSILTLPGEKKQINSNIEKYKGGEYRLLKCVEKIRKHLLNRRRCEIGNLYSVDYYLLH